MFFLYARLEIGVCNLGTKKKHPIKVAISYKFMIYEHKLMCMNIYEKRILIL